MRQDEAGHASAESSASAILEAVSAAAGEFLREEYSERSAERMLARLGAATGVSRTYLFGHREADESADVLADLRVEWVADGIAPQIANPQRLGWSYRGSGNLELLARFERGEIVAGSADELPAGFRPVLEEGGIRSILMTPVVVRGALWGVLGFDECRRLRRWSEPEIDALRLGASVLAAAIERATTDDDRRRGEEQERRAERMEAWGWLAAGLARDFDGLMATIRGHGEKLLGALRPGDPMREDVSEMLLAAERAAEVTRDLASLGRQQPARPTRLATAEWLTARIPLLRRLVGDAARLELRAAEPCGDIEADSDLLEQALVTFVLHARERVADGGVIEVGCSPVEPEELSSLSLSELVAGPAVRITVRDDGPALDQEAANRQFEPFFSTQGDARHGGLGLAAAYGIVRQFGGLVSMNAEPEGGNRCELLLPRADAPPQVLSEAARATGEPTRAPTVLLVEDEDLIRHLAEQILVDAGYRVLTAANASEATEIAAAATAPIDLLLTDVVMPGVSGADLAHRLLRQHPEMRILYMSGYSDSLIFRYGVLQERAAFLRKPFSAEILERRVEELIRS